MKGNTSEGLAMKRGEQIYAYLKDSILKNIIKPKDTIYEKQISADFQSSITPVREAIRRLVTECFVERLEMRLRRLTDP